jgi:hypothetical protein
MSLAETAHARSADPRHGRTPRGRCPFHNPQPEAFEAWIERDLRCSAGRREFRLGRYFVSRFHDGAGYRQALQQFRKEVAGHRKTGFLALFEHDEARCRTAEDELRLLGAAMRDAGLADDIDTLIAGATLGVPIEVACPVTGLETTYQFFAVAFCRHAGDPGDPLYDPSLSAPFTAVNMTSDAFAFARFVNDQAVKSWGKAPYQMTHCRDALELLFRRCVIAWQNMSITTIRNYSRVTVDPARGVHLTEDHKRWVAAHNDPVFAELEKCPHVHEMPIEYATRLTAKWSDNLFDGKPYVPSRDGQAGGVPAVEVEGLSDELYEF